MKNEVRRGRKFVEYHDDTQPDNVFTQEINCADVSYQDELGNWNQLDENWENDGLDGYILKADKMNHKIRLNGNCGRSWYPRRNVDTEYMTFGIPQYYSGTKWSNFGFSGWSVDGKTITLNTRQGVTILVHNRWNGIKIDWILTDASSPSRMRYPVALTGITESEGVLRGEDGTELGWLTPTTATDANEVELACSGSYTNGYVEFQTDISSAQFPVTIDPDFVSQPTWGMVTGGTALLPSGFDTTRTVIPLGVGQSTFNGIHSHARGFLQFDTSSIGNLSTITQVNLKMNLAYGTGTLYPMDIKIKKHDWSAYSPLSSSNYSSAYTDCLLSDYDNLFGFFSTAKLSLGYYTSQNLSTSWINKSGFTYYSIITSVDESNLDENESVRVFSSPSNGSNTPLLVVVYEAYIPQEHEGEATFSSLSYLRTKKA